jgi:hypothetical protein
VLKKYERKNCFSNNSERDASLFLSFCGGGGEGGVGRQPGNNSMHDALFFIFSCLLFQAAYDITF